VRCRSRWLVTDKKKRKPYRCKPGHQKKISEKKNQIGMGKDVGWTETGKAVIRLSTKSLEAASKSQPDKLGSQRILQEQNRYEKQRMSKTKGNKGSRKKGGKDGGLSGSGGRKRTLARPLDALDLERTQKTRC